MTDNMKLWESVFTTSRHHTKEFSKAGGFKGTAIKPYWLIKRATEVFGPCGIGWGWEELENKMVAGVWCSKVRLWYQRPTDEFQGKIEQWGQTVMEGTNKNGAFVDEEAPKKAVTDAVTKCLSYLGFGGDVHMGLFDDSKYIEKVKKEETARARNERYSEVKAALLESDDPAATWDEYKAVIAEFRAQDESLFDDLKRAGAARKAELMEHERLVAGYGKGFAEMPPTYFGNQDGDA